MEVIKMLLLLMMMMTMMLGTTAQEEGGGGVTVDGDDDYYDSGGLEGEGNGTQFGSTTTVGDDEEGTNGTNITTTSQLPFDNETYFVQPHSECTKMFLRSELNTAHRWRFWANGVATPVLALFGLTGNLVSISIMLQPKMRNSFNNLLIVLCGSDSVFILCNIVDSSKPLGLKNVVISAVAPYFNIFAHVSMCASVLLIVAFTFERHFAIRSPHQYRIHIRTTPPWRHLAFYVVPVTILSFFFNVPMFMNLQRSWMGNAMYVKINLWLRVFHPLTTTGLAPIAILTILNIRICKGIVLLHQRRTNRNAKEINMTYIAIAIVSLFVLTNMPRILLGFHEVWHTQVIIDCIAMKAQYIPVLAFYQVDCIARLLMIVNSSVNFLVYCGGSTQFQEVFCQKFVPTTWRRFFKSTCAAGSNDNNNNEDGNNNNGDDDDSGEEEVVTVATAPIQRRQIHQEQLTSFTHADNNGSAVNNGISVVRAEVEGNEFEDKAGGGIKVCLIETTTQANNLTCDHHHNHQPASSEMAATSAEIILATSDAISPLLPKEERNLSQQNHQESETKNKKQESPKRNGNGVEV